MPSELQLILNILTNFITAFLIVRFIYYNHKQSKKYVFTFLALNSTLFLIFNFLSNIELSFGVGFGLFAIFSVLRFRTDTIPSREMSYLFVLLALPMVNYALLDSSQYAALVISYTFIFALLLVLEKGWGFKYHETKSVQYEKIELIKPENRADLIRDLQERTGLVITDVEVNKINFLQDTAELKISYLGSNGYNLNCDDD
ncbi:MAG: hypothetical protein PWQ55_2561 [Chloroflexota bacterium]|nr:hypothetical protein [Chloroflexota bacterium]